MRTNFAAHLYSAPFARLARHPRMIDPVVQVFGEPVYMHQFKINGKMAFDGDVWQWHQDFGGQPPLEEPPLGLLPRQREGALVGGAGVRRSAPAAGTDRRAPSAARW